MNDFNKLCTAMATLNDEQADRVVSYIETLGKSQDTLKAEDKWQRVIDEGYLCKFRDNIGDHWRLEYLVDTNGDKFLDDDGDVWDNCEVLREKGIKQPYFQGDDIPTHWAVLVYFKNNHHLYRREVSYLDNIDWSEVVAYIEV